MSAINIGKYNIKNRSKPFSFIKSKLFIQVFTYGDKTHIYLYSFSKAILMLATFRIKVETSYKFYLYLLALLRWLKRLLLTVHLLFDPPYQSTCLSTRSCNGIQYCLRATHYCLQLVTRCSYLTSKLYVQAVGLSF